MAVDDRKKRILKHLKQSTEGVEYIVPQQTNEPPPTPPPTVVPQPSPPPSLGDDRKQRIMTHVQSSSGEFGNFSLTDDKWRKKIESHIRKSLN